MQRTSTGSLVRRLRHHVETVHLAEQPDRQLVQRFTADRDEAAFTTLVTRHGPMVLGVCRRVLGDWHTMEDVFQATFLVLARKASSIRNLDSLASWLYGVAYRLAIRVRVRTAHRQQRERAAAQRTIAGPAEEASVRELAAILDEELNRLPERYRAVLVLCYLEGRTRDDAAGQLGLPLRTLQRRLERGRKLLHVRLIRRGLYAAAALFAGALSQQPAIAAVPTAMVATTVGAVLGGSSSASAAALAAALAHSMRTAAWKTAAVLMMAFGCAIVGLGVMAHSLGVATEQPAPSAASQQPLPTPAGTRPGSDQSRYTTARAARPTAQAKDAAHLEHAAPVSCVAVAPDGKTVVSGGDSADATVRLWEVATGRQVYQVKVKSAVHAVAFSKGGKVAVGCADRTIRLLDARTGKQLATLRGHQETPANKEHYFPRGRYTGVLSLVFSDDGKTLISGGCDGTVRLWDVSSGKPVGVLSVAGHRVHRVALSCDGKTLAAGCEELAASTHHRVCLWNVTALQPIRPDVPRSDEIFSNGPITALAFTPDGKRLAVGGFDPEIMIWDVRTGKAVGGFRNGILWIVQSLAYSSDGQYLVAGCSDGRVHCWNVATGKPRWQITAHTGPSSSAVLGTSAIAFTPDGRSLVSGGWDKRVRVWNAATGTPRAFAK